jgi:hypothetical protein
MKRNVTHNKRYATYAQFADAMLGFLREQVPRDWALLRLGHRQLPRHLAQEFLGHDVNGV